MKILIKLLALFVLVITSLMILRILTRSSARKVAVTTKKNTIQQLFDNIKNKTNTQKNNIFTSGSTIDCATNKNCYELVFNGDNKYVFPNGIASPFSGYADPSIRKDPLTGTVWLAYSWPHFKTENGNKSPSSEIHLSKSTDNGKTWEFVKPLFNTTPTNNPAKVSQPGYLDYEVVNLRPAEISGKTTWFAVTLNYFIPTEGGFSARPSDSFHIRVYKSNSVEGLANAPFGVIGGGVTSSTWNVDQTLIPNDMNEIDKKYFFWNEPSLYYDNGKLYLTMVAFNLRNRTDITRDGVYVFSTDPTGDPSTWTWSYNGMLAGNTEASELGGERLTQVDIAQGVDGQLLMITSPDDWNTRYNDYNHKGCVALEIESMDTPKLKRDENDNLIVRAKVIDSQANELGSAACSYESGASTGILMTRRNKTKTELTASIWDTGARP